MFAICRHKIAKIKVTESCTYLSVTSCFPWAFSSTNSFSSSFNHNLPHSPSANHLLAVKFLKCALCSHLAVSSAKVLQPTFTTSPPQTRLPGHLQSNPLNRSSFHEVIKRQFLSPPPVSGLWGGVSFRLEASNLSRPLPTVIYFLPQSKLAKSISQ